MDVWVVAGLLGSVLITVVMVGVLGFLVVTAARESREAADLAMDDDAERAGEVEALLRDRERLFEHLAQAARGPAALRPAKGEQVVAAFPATLRLSGSGLVGRLTITTTRVHWDGPGRDWTRRWDQVVRWSVVDRHTVELQLENERPMRFAIRREDATCDPDIVIAALDHAYDASRRG